MAGATSGDHGGHPGHGHDEEKQIEEMLAVLDVVPAAARPLVPGKEVSSVVCGLAAAELAEDTQ